jgi:hypothetical protein
MCWMECFLFGLLIRVPKAWLKTQISRNFALRNYDKLGIPIVRVELLIVNSEHEKADRRDEVIVVGYMPSIREREEE